MLASLSRDDICLTGKGQLLNLYNNCESTIIIKGSCPRSRINSLGSSLLIWYSSLAVSFPRYVTCRSLHSAGRISRFLVENLLEGGSMDFSTITSLILILSWFFPSGPVRSSPSRYVFIPMSFNPSAIRPSLSNSALKESTCGAIAALSAGYAVWSLGGLRKRFSLRNVWNSWSQVVLVGEEAEGGMAELGGSQQNILSGHCLDWKNTYSFNAHSSASNGACSKVELFDVFFTSTIKYLGFRFRTFFLAKTGSYRLIGRLRS